MTPRAAVVPAVVPAVGFVGLVGIALAVTLLVGVAAQSGPRFGGDWLDYRTASLRLAAGESPYAPDMFGAPVPAQGVDRYRYPPLLAQVVLPIAALPPTLGSSLWSALMVALLLGGTWLGVVAAGTLPRPAALVFAVAGVAWFMPTVATAWTGNASATFALAVGGALFIGARSGGGARDEIAAAGAVAFAAVSRLAPLSLMPAVLRRGGPVRTMAIAAVAGLVAASLLLAPFAWRDYLTVLPNILRGSAQFENNLAPDAILVGSGASPIIGSIVRALAVVLGASLLLSSYRVAAHEAAWPAAVAMGVVAALVIPPVLWYHYLTALLPLAAFAWFRGGPQARLSIAASTALIDVGLVFPVVAAVGAGCLATSLFGILLPRTEPRTVPALP